ncbi:MAG: efflux RND transporter periplasmic adaptor subunit [Hyphomicrobium sp.]
MVKVNSTVVTLGIAGILAIAIGVYVNSRSWGPVVAEDQAQTASEKAPDSTAEKSARRPTWAASATGRVEPQSGEVRITAEVPGKIELVGIDVNDRVKGGDLLIRLNDEEALTKVMAASAEADVRVRERDEENVKGLADDRRAAEDAVASAERAVFGARQAFDDVLAERRVGMRTQEAVDDARSELKDAKKKLTDERAALATVNAKTGMPLATRLESGLAIARAELSAAEIAVERTRIRAPFDGTVLNLIAKEGEVAVPSPGNTLLIFGDLARMKVRAEVEERDAAKIRVGQRAIIRADAYPDQDFTGRVSSVAQSLSTPRIATRGPRRPNDVEVLEAVIDLDGLPPLLTGMRVDVFFKHETAAATAATMN